jgi:tetratricopeptide (TPR) repeat protein
VCVRHPYPDLLADKMLTDQKRSEEALVLLEPWAATQPEAAEIWLALGYAALRSDDRFETLRAYGQALRLQPTNREAADAMAGVLLELGALPPETPLGIQVRQAGALVRWAGHVLPREPRRRFESMEAALERIEGLLEKARSASRPDTGLIARLRRDRLRLSHNLCDIRSASEVLIIRSKR